MVIASGGLWPIWLKKILLYKISGIKKTLSQGQKNGAYKGLQKLDVILPIPLENHFYSFKKILHIYYYILI